MIEYIAKANHRPVSTTEPMSAIGRFRRGLRTSSATVVEDSNPKNASTMNTKASPRPPKPDGECVGRNAVGTCPWSPPLNRMSSSKMPAIADLGDDERQVKAHRGVHRVPGQRADGDAR